MEKLCTRRSVLLACLLLVGCAADGEPAEAKSLGSRYLAGQLLVASPQIADPRFAETVIYIVSHDRNGAMGLVLNRSLGRGSLRAMVEGSGGIYNRLDIPVDLRSGGPVDRDRGFVLHGTDYTGPSTQVVGRGLALSTDTHVLSAIAEGHGPKQCLFIFGYAGWGPDQLERELARDDWFTATPDRKLMFTPDPRQMWPEAMKHAGVAL